MKALELVVHGGHVVRFHTKPTLKEETVAEHSYLVAWLIALLLPELPSPQLLLAALAHDLPEHVLGDMPSPTKRLFGLETVFRDAEASIYKAAGLPDYEGMLTLAEAELLKFCDNMAGYLKCRYEQQLGNRHLDRIALRYREYLADNIANANYMDKSAAVDLLRWASSEQPISLQE